MCVCVCVCVCVNNIDAQCNYNRSGLLCGKCKKGFSLVFGSSKCIKCSNSYISLLISFALAGIVLVVFLLVLKLTVAVGTINGLFTNECNMRVHAALYYKPA